MGWKNVKQHYAIEHIVHVREGAILIGSAYVSDLLSIDKDGNVTKPHAHLGDSGDLVRVRRAMEADRNKLRELIVTPDTFGPCTAVYTYDEDRIIEKQCEEFGWPNVTTDGELMYENLHFRTRAETIKKAKRNADAWLESLDRQIADRQREIDERQKLRDHWKEVSRRLVEAAS